MRQYTRWIDRNLADSFISLLDTEIHCMIESALIAHEARGFSNLNHHQHQHSTIAWKRRKLLKLSNSFMRLSNVEDAVWYPWLFLWNSPPCQWRHPQTALTIYQAEIVSKPMVFTCPSPCSSANSSPLIPFCLTLFVPVIFHIVWLRFETSLNRCPRLQEGTSHDQTITFAHLPRNNTVCRGRYHQESARIQKDSVLREFRE